MLFIAFLLMQFRSRFSDILTMSGAVCINLLFIYLPRNRYKNYVSIYAYALTLSYSISASPSVSRLDFGRHDII